MRNPIERAIPAVLFLALPFALAPATANAQEEEREPAVQQETEVERTCTVTFDSQKVETGQAAVRLQGDLDASIGEVEGLEPGESGIVLASREDIRGAEVKLAARPEETPTEEAVPAEEAEEAEDVRAIETSPDGARVTVWLNTEDANPGTHAVTLRGAEGECTAQLTVEGDEETGAETEELESEQPPVQPPAGESEPEQPEPEQPRS